jgi:hypothetical protein
MAIEVDGNLPRNCVGRGNQVAVYMVGVAAGYGVETVPISSE